MTVPVATARLDLCACVLHVDADVLAARLRELGPLALAAADESGRAPICIELWMVRDGRMRPFGIDQERWYEAGAMLFGSAYGALLGPAGSLSGARLGQSWGRALSTAVTRTVGHYCELLIGVPEVRLGAAPPSYFVAGMRTDSTWAMRSDHALGYGFGKQPAKFAGELATGMRIEDATREELMSMRVGDASAADFDLARLTSWLTRPLLAASRGGLVRSSMTRAFPPVASMTTRPATLRVSSALHPWLDAVAGERTVGAFQASNVQVGLSLPSPVPRDPHHAG